MSVIPSFDRIQVLRREAIDERLERICLTYKAGWDDLDDIRDAIDRVSGPDRIQLKMLANRISESFWQLPDSWTMPTVAEVQSIRAAIDAQEADHA